MLFSYSLQIFPEVFFFFPETFGFRLGFPTSPAVSGTAYITSLTAISLDCGCKSRHFLLTNQMFYRLFLKYFLLSLTTKGLQRKKKRGTYRVSPLNPVSAPFILSVRARQGSPETQNGFSYHIIRAEHTRAFYQNVILTIYPSHNSVFYGHTYGDSQKRRSRGLQKA